MNRRTLLQLLAGAAAAPLLRGRFGAALAAPPARDDFFVFIHAAGGWDVTLWADPRNERRGLVEPASTANTDIAGLTHWKSAPLDGTAETFEPLTAANLRLGPGIGALYDLRDRFTIINGLAMNTVSHADGIAFSATGRHLTGGHVPASSVDVMIANELGAAQMLPAVSVQFPSHFVGAALDRRVIPLQVTNAAMIAKSLARADAYLDAADRSAIARVLTEEAATQAGLSVYPAPYERFASQQEAVARLVDQQIGRELTQPQLQAKYAQFDYKARGVGNGWIAAAFALEAMRRNLVRCVAFSAGAFDTHDQNYRTHARSLQDLFGGIATLVQQLDAIPHPTKPTAKLSEHTHILVFSEFCRSPQLAVTGGRDHYPNNSALVISPRFRGGTVVGSTDLEQLLPAGGRPLAPPDLLATFVAAFGIEPRRYLRDGEVVPALLAT